ncbi:MAG TPA: acyltransferase [Edaphobacter sp.]|nr:acyltransferase [Edaphobacter sp.]
MTGLGWHSFGIVPTLRIHFGLGQKAKGKRQCGDRGRLRYDMPPVSDDVPLIPLAIGSQSIAAQDAENPGGFVHIPALDGIRGLAVLMVLFDHLFWSNPVTGNRIFDLLNAIREASYVGVNLFFALSGFLITGILLDTLNTPRFFANFYARRTLRIFPLYYGLLLVLLLLTRPLHFVWSGWQYYYLTYTSNLALWRSHVPLVLGRFNINHFWSLQVEEQFYLIWPFIVYRVRRPLTLVRISLVSCGVILGIRIFLVAMRGQPGFDNIYLPYSPTFSCADNILFGCCLCALLRSGWSKFVVRFAPRVLAVSAGILLIAAVRNHGLDFATSTFVPTIGFSLVGICCAAIIAMTLKTGSKTQWLFKNGALRFFGKYSYGIYVFHYSLDGFFSGPIRASMNAHFHNKALSVVAGAFVVGVASVLIALLSYHLYEVRFLKLKKYFSYR